MNFIDQLERDLVQAGRRRAGRRRWRLPVVGMAGLATAAAGAVAIVLLPGGGALSAVDEARAALGAPDEILHYVVDETWSIPGQPRRPGDCRQDGNVEGWTATGGKTRWRVIVPGQTGADCGFVTQADGSPTAGPQEI